MGIELAGTTVYTHYAITIKIVYTTIIVIRRFYYIKDLETSVTQYMGYQIVPSTFDLKQSENRAFKTLEILPGLSTSTETAYEFIINELNKKSNVALIAEDVDSYKYRTFPIGRYIIITIIKTTYIAHAHFYEINSVISLSKWNPVPTSTTSNE